MALLISQNYVYSKFTWSWQHSCWSTWAWGNGTACTGRSRNVRTWTLNVSSCSSLPSSSSTPSPSSVLSWLRCSSQASLGPPPPPPVADAAAALREVQMAFPWGVVPSVGTVCRHDKRSGGGRRGPCCAWPAAHWLGRRLTTPAAAATGRGCLRGEH